MLLRLALIPALLASPTAAAVAAWNACGPQYGTNANTGLWDCYFWHVENYVGDMSFNFDFSIAGPQLSGLPAFSARCTNTNGGGSSYHPCTTTSGSVTVQAYLTSAGALAQGLGTLHVRVGNLGGATYSVTNPNVSFNKGQSPAYGIDLYPDTKGG